MSLWPSIPRRWLLRLAGAGLVSAPLDARAAAAVEGGAGAADAPETWQRFFAVQRIWGYVDRHSVAPGERLNLMLAGGPGEPDRRLHVEVFRIGAKGASLVWRSDPITVGHRAAGKTAPSVGPGWPPALAGIDTSSWPPGCYSVDAVEEVTGVRDVRVVQFLVRNPARPGRILLRLGTNTYQAYNTWGGHSLYPSEDASQKGAMVSFDRPCPPSFFEYDVYLVAWLEDLAARTGLGVDYASNFDVHAEPAILDRYDLVICGSHDEYWSGEEFDAFERRIFKTAKATAFFGGNTAYFQVRYADLNRPPDGADRGRQLVCFKSLDDPIAQRESHIDPKLLVTARFRDDARRPELMLMGAAYQGWFDATGPQRPGYFVQRTDLPFFDGVGWSVGDLAAEVVGYEWDNRDPLGDGQRLYDPARSHIALLPADRIEVLFRGEPIDANGQPGVAEAVYFESPAGAKVFDAGAIRWAWGLGKEGFVRPAFQRFNENLIRALVGR